MTVFISGGCKNGKSSFAQDAALQLSAGGKRYYVATMQPHDDEDEARVARHVRDRDGLGFETLECGTDILSCLEHADKDGSFLLDSVTALLANEMFRDGGLDKAAPARVADGLMKFCGTVKNAVFVSDFLYSDAARYDEWTEGYRSGLALVDRALAARCDTVAEISAGVCIMHKGELPV